MVESRSLIVNSKQINSIASCFRRWKRSHGGDVYTTTASMATTHAHNNYNNGNNGTAMCEMRKINNVDNDNDDTKEEETALLDHKNNGCNSSKVRFTSSKV